MPLRQPLDFGEDAKRYARERLGRLRWLDSFAVGDDRLDEQHRRFFTCAGRIAQLVDTEAPVAELAAAIRILRADALDHFTFEERALEEIGFPGAETHKAVHREIMHRLADLAGPLDQLDDPDELAVIAHGMVIVLLEHMLGEDMLYKSHLLRSRGY